MFCAFYPGPDMLLPLPDRFLVPFSGSFVGVLATPSRALHQLPDIGDGVAHLKFAAAHFPDAPQCPDLP